jgi:hypothetical protein
LRKKICRSLPLGFCRWEEKKRNLKAGNTGVLGRLLTELTLGRGPFDRSISRKKERLPTAVHALGETCTSAALLLDKPTCQECHVRQHGKVSVQTCRRQRSSPGTASHNHREVNGKKVKFDTTWRTITVQGSSTYPLSPSSATFRKDIRWLVSKRGCGFCE